jgi:ribonucleoside-diphosphate reductase beta chain
LYLKGVANNWVPTEVPMGKDIEQWKGSEITEDEKLLVKRCLGFFAGSESLVSNNLLINIFKWVTSAECRQYIIRQTYEESIHNLTIVYICESLGLEVNEVYEAYRNIPSIKEKDDFLRDITRDISRVDFNTDSLAGKRELLRNLITYYIICEGIFFYSGFAMLLSLGRQNKMPGISEQVQYTIRDESLHIQFGINLIHEIIKEYPEVWTEEFKEETKTHILEACSLEIEYAKDCLPNGILGLNAEMFISYMWFIGNRRLTTLGLPEMYLENVSNPFPWLSESIDLPKVKNFFETRVTDYSGTIKDDLD